MAMAPGDMLLHDDHGPRSNWRIFVDVPDRPGGVDMFVRAMAAIYGYALACTSSARRRWHRTLFMRLTAPSPGA